MVAMRADPDHHDGGDEDAALVAAAQADRRAFAALYERYFDLVHAYCLRRLPGRETAADATGQIFLKAMAALPAFRSGRSTSFRSWLFAIAHNVCIDTLRQLRPHADLDAAGDLAGPEPGPEASALAAAEHRSVAALLARLTPDQRRVVELRLAGLTGQEVADALGLSLSAVKAAQFRAYARLRRILTADSSHQTPEADDAHR